MSAPNDQIIYIEEQYHNTSFISAKLYKITYQIVLYTTQWTKTKVFDFGERKKKIAITNNYIN